MKLKQMILLILLILSSSVTFAESTEDIQWLAVMRLDTPRSIWQKIVATEELKPVFNTCKDKWAQLILPGNFELPAEELFDQIFYLALGRDTRTERIYHYIWTRDNSGKDVFMGRFNNFFEPFNKYYRQNNPQSKNIENMPMPEQIASLNAENHFHLKFFGQVAAGQIFSALEEEVLFDEKKNARICAENLRKMTRRLKKDEITGLPENALPTCPLQGKYSFDASAKRFFCSHRITKPDFSKLDLDSFKKSALGLYRCFDNLRSFEVKLPKTSNKMFIEVDGPENLDEQLALGDPFVSIPKWFNNLHEFDRFSSEAGMHLVFSPDFVTWLENMKKMHPDGTAMILPGLSVDKIMPAGPVLLTVFGDLDLRSGSFPSLILSAVFPDEALIKVKEIAESGQLPFKLSSCEIYGRILDVFEMPEQEHRFNSVNASDNRIYLFPESAKRISVCVSELAVRQKIAGECGEKKLVSIWSDIEEPVKFAFAYRADGIAGGLLNFLNGSAFQLECNDCGEKRYKWLNQNRALAEKLGPGDEVPPEAAKICPRGGIYIGNKHEKLSCAVHNFRREIQLKLYQAEIPVGRWLRVYVTKNGETRRLTIDFMPSQEVK